MIGAFVEVKKTDFVFSFSIIISIITSISSRVIIICKHMGLSVQTDAQSVSRIHLISFQYAINDV